MSSEKPTLSLEITGDFHDFTYAREAARELNGQKLGMEPIEVDVDRQKSESDDTLQEGFYHFQVSGIRRGMKTQFLRKLEEVKEANPRLTHLHD